jgi:hypothetical protein
MEDFNKYLNEKIEDDSSLINENIEIKKEKTFQNIVEYNWYVDETKDLLMDIGLVARPPVVKKSRAKKEK